MSIEAVLRRAAALTAKSEQMLSEPRPVNREEWRVPEKPKPVEKQHPTESQSARLFQQQLVQLQHEIEQLRESHERLKESLQTDYIDMIASESGLLERRLRKEIESLRGEVTLIRAAKAGLPQSRKAISRAPWKDSIDASLTAN